jgi:hypothetical protein
MTPPVELAAYVEAGVINADDVAAVALLVEIASREPAPPVPDLRAWIALGLAVRAPRDGHTCVLLEEIADWAGDIDLAQAGHLRPIGAGDSADQLPHLPTNAIALGLQAAALFLQVPFLAGDLLQAREVQFQAPAAELLADELRVIAQQALVQHGSEGGWGEA